MYIIMNEGLFLRDPLEIGEQCQLKHTYPFGFIDFHTLHNHLFYLN